MDTYPPEAWKRLGSVLASRRGQLGFGFRQRSAFAEANGLKLSARTLQRLEQAERGAYPEETLAVVEAIYRLEPGSVVRVLRGGEPAFLAEEKKPAGELTAQCIYEEEILTTPDISDDSKRQLVRVHRRRGHSERCGPFAKPEADPSERRSALSGAATAG